jgi:hypothetical protein
MAFPDRLTPRPAGAPGFHDAAYLWSRAVAFRRQAALARDRVAAEELFDLAYLYAAEAMRARIEELIPSLRRP